MELSWCSVARHAESHVQYDFGFLISKPILFFEFQKSWMFYFCQWNEIKRNTTEYNGIQRNTSEISVIKTDISVSLFNDVRFNCNNHVRFSQNIIWYLKIFENFDEKISFVRDIGSERSEKNFSMWAPHHLRFTMFTPTESLPTKRTKVNDWILHSDDLANIFRTSSGIEHDNNCNFWQN